MATCGAARFVKACRGYRSGKLGGYAGARGAAANNSCLKEHMRDCPQPQDNCHKTPPWRHRTPGFCDSCRSRTNLDHVTVGVCAQCGPSYTFFDTFMLSKHTLAAADCPRNVRSGKLAVVAPSACDIGTSACCLLSAIPAIHFLSPPFRVLRPVQSTMSSNDELSKLELPAYMPGSSVRALTRSLPRTRFDRRLETHACAFPDALAKTRRVACERAREIPRD
jgi:hypothetical protein